MTDRQDTPATEHDHHSDFPISDRANRLYVLGDALDSPAPSKDVLQRAAELIDDIERELRQVAAMEGIDLRPDRERPPNAPRWLTQLAMTFQAANGDPTRENVERLDELSGQLDESIVAMASQVGYTPEYANDPDGPDWEPIARSLAERHMELVYEASVEPAHREFMTALKAGDGLAEEREALATALSEFDDLVAELTDDFGLADVEHPGPSLPENWDEAVSE